MFKVFDIWCDQQTILVNNRIVELQEKLYAAGFNIELTPDQIGKVIADEERLKTLYETN